MKALKRLAAGLLTLAMTASLCPPAMAAQPTQPPVQSTGSITTSLRFALPQTKAAVDRHNLTLTLSTSDERTVIPLSQGSPIENTLNASVQVTAKNQQDVEMTTEAVIGFYETQISGLLPNTEYTLQLTGDGYTNYEKTFTLTDYSQYLAISTGDGSFALGDLDNSGTVDLDDLSIMDQQLGKTDAASIAQYDLDGDGKINVKDLSYVNYVQGLARQEVLYDTSAIFSGSVETSNLNLNNDLSELFQPETVVTITPKTQASSLEIPIEFAETSEVSQIQITCPDGDGAIESGVAVVEFADGTVSDYPFPNDNNDNPADVHAIGPRIGERTVTIDLGKKVPVKKVTVRVTAVTGQDGQIQYVAVTQIEFLKDIVPDVIEDTSQVKGLSAKAGNESVTLAWRAVNNITGYTVYYGQSQDAMTQTFVTNTNRAVVSGLENLKTYYFYVVATNNDWQGTASAVISATPYPSQAPGAPSNIRVEAADQALRLSWGGTENADFYEAYYRVAGESNFTQFGGKLPSTNTVITGLTNGVTYEVAVKAGNDVGTSAFSAIASGTPKLEIIEMPSLPTDDRLDNSIIESVVMGNRNNVNTTLCPNFDPMHVVDSDASTYWIARAWWESSAFTYTFTQPQDINYVILVPYLGGNYKYALSTYVVTVKDAAGNVLLDNKLYGAPAMTDKNYLVLPFESVKGAKSITISLNEREGNGCRVSVSEMAFYKSDGLVDDIAALFTDRTFTALASGVTAEQISALKARLETKLDFYMEKDRLLDELDLALGLLNQDASVLGVVKNDFQTRTASADSQYGQSASSLQPLGVTAEAGATLAVYAELPSDQPVYVVPTQFFGESGVWQGTAIRLNPGRNLITVEKIGSLTDPRGGPFYLTYAGSNPEQIKVHVRGDSKVTAIPVLELSDWYRLDETSRRTRIQTYITTLQTHAAQNSANPTINIRNATEISTPSVLLSIPATQALAGLSGTGNSVDQMVEILYQDILAWEEIMFVTNKVQSIIGENVDFSTYQYPMQTRQNIRYMRMFAGAFMYAAGAHIGIGYGSCSGMVQGHPANTGSGYNGLFGWGIAHEIGHNMDKLGKAEITNNIYSLAVQAWDRGSMAVPTRLQNSGIWPKVFEKTAAGRPGAANNVFVQLGMYWQLHLAYDEGSSPLSFYNRFFQKWKAGEYSGYSYDERVALIASDVANRNLAAFFTRWGMTLSENVKGQLSAKPEETRAIWYLNDESYSYRLSGGAAYSNGDNGTIAVSENTVTITLPSENPAVQGYEIRRNGTPIGFTAGGTYVDNLGAANNLAYTYSIVTVDKLGNMSQPVQLEPVRIAYDKTIAPDLYDMTTDETGAVVFTMRNGEVPITGLKFNGTTAIPEGCTVQIKTAGSDEWKAVTLQANGHADENGAYYVSYFNKPGMDTTDTRIWTYDVSAVRIMSLPEGTGGIEGTEGTGETEGIEGTGETAGTGETEGTEGTEGIEGTTGIAEITVELLDYPGDRVDFYPGASVGILASDYSYTDASGNPQTITAGTLVITGTYRGDPVFNTVEVEGRYTTWDPESEGEIEANSVERPMNGYGLFFAEIPADGAVSDTSDGFFLFVPNLEEEKETNAAGGVTDDYPLEISVKLYRTDNPNDSTSRRLTSETLWITFPEGEDLPQIQLTGTTGR